MTELTRIIELSQAMGISSRTLRYYEQVGLLESVRPASEKYRYYDPENIERLRQILVLRKMEIPVKDILRIYESRDMSVIVEAFVHRLQDIDEEVTALSELRRIVDAFLQAMLENGITKITALPLLYEALVSGEQREAAAHGGEPGAAYAELSAVSRALSRPVETSIVNLPMMRVLTSLPVDTPGESDPEGFWRFAQTHGISPGEPGRHEQFETQTEAGDVVMLRVPEGFAGGEAYQIRDFPGGLFATAQVYLDEDLGERFRALVASFDENKYYQVDYLPGGGLRQEAMLETLLSPDEKRDLAALFVPIKRRLPDPTLFGQPEELPPGSIPLEEIERANPVLWSHDVRMDQLIPINGPHYRVTEAGEAEYVSWISTRVLSTNVSVKLPFRVDVEFRIGEESGGWGHDKNETSIRFHHGEDLNFLFGINMHNNPDERLSQEALCFHQPVFGDYYEYPKRGRIHREGYNRLTWIVGPRHFAVIINGEIRFCGVHFPYMEVELRHQQARPIIMGSDSSVYKYFRAIRVSQLAQTPKTRIPKGALTRVTRQSNNRLPDLQRFITSEYGENYWFNGCARYVMRALGEYREEPDFGYWFFAGLTGDVLAQVYSYGEYMGESVSSCRFTREGGGYLERIFEKCGYASTFVTGERLRANPEMYLQTLLAYIDKGVPVIAVTHGGPPWGVYVGYEEYGKTLLFLTGDKVEPERVPLKRILAGPEVSEDAAVGWLFVGQKERAVDLPRIYREAVYDIPRLFALQNDAFCFGAEAFRAWADGMEGGRFEGVTPGEFGDGWGWHVSNVCNMATNGSCAFAFLERAWQLNPDFTFMEEIRRLYKRTEELWNTDHGRDLEALGGGFNVTLEALQAPERRGRIAAVLREAAGCMDQVVEIVKAHLPRQ